MKIRFPVSIEMVMPLAMGRMDAKTFPMLAQAVETAALTAQAMWKAYAYGKQLPDGSRINSRSGAYGRSITFRKIGEFKAEVYSDLPYAKSIEEGMPARDMKKMLDTSAKVRMSKAGKRYLIIPFRWGTPGAVTMGNNVMPDAVHEMAKSLEASRVKSVGQRESGNGAWNIKTRAPMKVAQREYLWGGRLKQEQISQAGEFGAKAKRMAGMVKFQSVLTGIGGAKHTQYMTFRVMVEGSKGWIAPAIAGKHPARTVSEQMRPRVEKLFHAAMEEDVRAAMGQR